MMGEGLRFNGSASESSAQPLPRYYNALLSSGPKREDIKLLSSEQNYCLSVHLSVRPSLPPVLWGPPA